jgi:hypothetical protein
MRFYAKETIVLSMERAPSPPQSSDLQTNKRLTEWNH